MIIRLLFRNAPIVQTIGATLGGILGLGILLLSIQLYNSAQRSLYESDELLRPGYLMVSKPVTLMRTFSGKAKTFNAGELEALKASDKVEEVAPFISSSFRVSAYLKANEQTPPFYTELFFEALPDEFLDVDEKDWEWNVGDGFIPVVIPRQYLALYNFGFAKSQNLPQISEGVIRNIQFDITLGDASKRPGTFKGRIVAFTDRVNSILVPHEFLSWANKEYGVQQEDGPSRLALKVLDQDDPALHEFLSKEGYEVAGAEGSGSSLKRFVDMSFVIVLGIGVVILVLASLVLMLTFQLLVHRNSTTIEYLMDLGHSLRSIQMRFLRIQFILSLIIFFGAWSSFVFFNSRISNELVIAGISSTGIFWQDLITTSVVVVLLLLLVDQLLLRKKLTRIFWGRI